MPVLGPELVATRVEALEVCGDRRVVDRLFAFVLNQVLLTDVRDVALLRIFVKALAGRCRLGEAPLAAPPGLA